jgi:hypothetical protein
MRELRNRQNDAPANSAHATVAVRKLCTTDMLSAAQVATVIGLSK